MNDPNKHSAFVQLPSGVKAFIDGIPDKCEHDYTGDPVYFTASGKTIYWHTFRQWASLTTKAREPLIYDHQYKIDDPIIGGAVTCKKCKKIFHPPMF